jgi:hypothetical protein
LLREQLMAVVVAVAVLISILVLAGAAALMAVATATEVLPQRPANERDEGADQNPSTSGDHTALTH